MILIWMIGFIVWWSWKKIIFKLIGKFMLLFIVFLVFGEDRWQVPMGQLRNFIFIIWCIKHETRVWLYFLIGFFELWLRFGSQTATVWGLGFSASPCTHFCKLRSSLRGTWIGVIKHQTNYVSRPPWPARSAPLVQWPGHCREGWRREKMNGK